MRQKGEETPQTRQAEPHPITCHPISLFNPHFISILTSTSTSTSTHFISLPPVLSFFLFHYRSLVKRLFSSSFPFPHSNTLVSNIPDLQIPPATSPDPLLSLFFPLFLSSSSSLLRLILFFDIYPYLIPSYAHLPRPLPSSPVGALL